ncbi:phage FluMu protein gp41 [Streptacidiphilus sp. MAP12-16]|uniref:hypothetical protein n=1 Tax=Streptacidiphilus sp. MAP12-16 TaxID=3156300 RepID=UPI0035110FC0
MRPLIRRLASVATTVTLAVPGAVALASPSLSGDQLLRRQLHRPEPRHDDL